MSMVFHRDNDEYRNNYEAITAALAYLPHVEIVEIAPCITGDIIEKYVCLTLRLDQHIIIKFLYLTADSVQKTELLSIGQFGQLTFQTCWPGEECSQHIHSVTIRKNSELSEAFNVEIQNIQDVIIHHQTILDVFEQFPNIPESTHRTRIKQITFYKKRIR